MDEVASHDPTEDERVDENDDMPAKTLAVTPCRIYFPKQTNKQKRCIFTDLIVDIWPCKHNPVNLNKKFEKFRDLQPNMIFLLLIFLLLRRNKFSLYRVDFHLYRNDRKPNQTVANSMPHSEFKRKVLKSHTTLNPTFSGDVLT